MSTIHYRVIGYDARVKVVWTAMEDHNDATLTCIEWYFSFVRCLLTIELFIVMIVINRKRRQLEHYEFF